MLDGGERPALAFSADGRYLATGGGGTVRIVDTTAWQLIAALPGTRIAWDPAAARLLTGSGAGDVSIWSVPNGARLHHLRAIGEPVDAAAWSPGGTRVAVALRDGVEQVFDTETGRLMSAGNLAHGRLLSIDFSPDGSRLVAAAASGIVAISEAATGAPAAVFDAPVGAARSARFDPTSDRIVGATWDGIAWVWNGAPPYQRWSSGPLTESCGLLGGAEPDGRYIPVGCPGHPTRIWDTANDQLLAELPAIGAPRVGGPIPYPAVSAAGDRAAIARGKTAEQYRLPGGRLVGAVAHGAAVTALAFGPGGELTSGDTAGAVLMTRGDQTIELAAAGRAGIDALAALPGDRIAAADARGRVRIFARGAAVAEFDAGIRARVLRPSPDGRRLLVVSSYGGNATPALLDLAGGAVTRLTGSPVYAARWTPQGILTAHADGAARIWNADGRLVATLRGDRGFLVDATLSSDGAMVIGASADGTLRFWDAPTGGRLWSPQAPTLHPVGISAGSWGIVVRSDGGDVSRWVLPEPTTVIDARKGANALPGP